jgi:hypothetical protein
MSNLHAPWKFGVYKYDDDGNRIFSELPYDYRSGQYCDNPFIYDANGELVAGCDEYYAFSTPEKVRLMVHAPELLEALKRLVDFHVIAYGLDGAWDEQLKMAQKAIAKAEGK